MFEKMKRKSFEEGVEQGFKRCSNHMEWLSITDCSNKITYATSADYGKASVILNAKDKEIASLKDLVSKLEASKRVSKSITKKQKETMSAMENELEVFYLKAIGDCKTVKQVNAVLKRYHESGSFKAWVSGVMEETFMVSLFSGKQITPKGSRVDQAAATKIKRINRKNIIKICKLLDNKTDNATYAHVMMSEIKEITGKEVDGKKILDAKASGLDAMSVFKSILSAYSIKQDDVFAE